MDGIVLQTFLENDTQEIYRLFLDMDGCICDFNKQFEKTSGVPSEGYEETHGKDAFWKIVDSAGEKFWTDMEWMPDGKELWEYVKKYDPTILTAPSRNPASVTGKVKWLKANIPDLPNFDVQRKAKQGWDGKSKILMNAYKYLYAKNKFDILIDDNTKKLDAWKNVGTGILHKNTKDTIEQLKKLGL